MAVGLDRDRIDDADVQFACDDAGRNHAAARDRDHGTPRSVFTRALMIQPPCQRAAVAVHLLPRDVKPLLVWELVVHGPVSRALHCSAPYSYARASASVVDSFLRAIWPMAISTVMAE